MSRSPRPSPTLAGAILLSGLSLSTSALAMTDLDQGYALGTQTSTPPQTEDPTATPAQSATHIEHNQPSAKTAEGKCGAHAPTTADSKKKAGKATAKHHDKAMTEGKCGEGKCGGGG
ncbi:hypothetical protein [Xanthomonas sp. MUS 060]|uniref:hypothetical protein n=1 Tax=Xanthomonas sp. MUS 060 TaxID=1588031 RepID=UPI0005F2A49F|nr:hypothetical protein [Xanthomonas sp. MUS 060]